MSPSLAFAFRRLRRGWNSGELLILGLALAIAVAASSAVGLFTERVRSAIASQTGEAVGADALYTSRDPLPEDFVATLQARGLQLVRNAVFASVAVHGEDTALVSAKAVEPGYPLRGTLRLTSEPFGSERAADGVPPSGEVWIDLRLWQELGLRLGSDIQLGNSTFRVGALVAYEPDRGGGFTDLAPRVLMNWSDLAGTGLVTVGSRVQHGLMVAGTPAQIAELKTLEPPREVRHRTPEDARPEIRRALDRAGLFLDIAVLAATLLAAAAVALSAHQHGLKLRDEVALLKCLGAGSRYIGRALIANLLLLGLVAGSVGALIGLAAQEVISQLLGSLLNIDLPAPPLAPLLSAFGLGLLMLLGFATPPVLQARNTPPIRVFQRDVAAGATRWVPLSAAAAVVTLLWWQTGDPKLAAYVLGGALGTCALLALLAWLLVRALAPLRRAGGTAVRFGLGNIARRRGASVAQVVALGLALLALLLVSVVRSDLLSAWQNRLPPDTPNQFLINIQSEQVQPLQAFFAARGYPDLRIWPMARARLVALRGEPVTADSFDDPETQRWINREFNLSWSDTLNPDNKITSGEWWGAEGHGKPLLSVDEYGVERLGLKLGDSMTLDFAGTTIEFTVASTRTVSWDTFRPNFFLIVPTGVLDVAGADGRPAVAAQWLSSFYLPPERRALLRELIGEFPSITALDIGSLMGQVRGIMDRVVRAVEFIFLFTLAAGLAVLLAAIEGTRSERVRETGLLRALGARTGTIARGLLAEYAALGLLAGVVASICAQALAWVLAAQVFDIPYGPRPLLWLAGAGGGAALVTVLGYLSLRKVLNTPPRIVLSGG